MLGSIWFQKCSCEREIWFASAGSGNKKNQVGETKIFGYHTPLLVPRKSQNLLEKTHRTVNVAISQCSGIKGEIVPYSCATYIQNNLVQILTQTERHCVHFSDINWNVILIFLHICLFVKSNAFLPHNLSSHCSIRLNALTTKMQLLINWRTLTSMPLLVQ